jgi:hypothetical protein
MPLVSKSKFWLGRQVTIDDENDLMIFLQKENSFLNGKASTVRVRLILFILAQGLVPFQVL